MDKTQTIILISLLTISALSWVLLKDQSDPMEVMMNFNLATVLFFIIIWIMGMTAMMFPAISPMVLLYTKLIRNGEGQTVTVRTPHVLQTMLFIGSYLAIWSLTGIALLFGWSSLTNNPFLQEAGNLSVISGIIFVVAGAYQFSQLKTKCLRYCESPTGFFMRHWKNGKSGAIRMGMWHGLYCLGCCWPYFLLMIALSWMSLLWMGLFAAIIFGEKIWSRGIWIARLAGTGFIVLGLISLFFPDMSNLLVKF